MKKLPPLPKPKEKKPALFGRVGVSTEKLKLASAIDVVAKKKNIIEELPPINDATYDISMEEISHKMTQDEVPLCDDIELVCTGESKVMGKSFSNKRRNLLFSSEGKTTVLNKQMLTDESINIA